MWDSLTPSERIMAEAIALGWTPQETCRNLNIADSTRRHQEQSIREKLGLASRTQIAVWMWKNGRMGGHESARSM